MAATYGSAQGYTAFGAVWYRMGSLPTDRTYTGQTEIEFGLLHYGARAYDPGLARWVQPDTIIPQPGNPMAWDRFAYTLNNPLKFSDPSGHGPVCEGSYYGCTRKQYFNVSLINGSLQYWKWAIKAQFGISLRDGTDYDKTIDNNDGTKTTTHYKGRQWDLVNARIAGTALATTASIQIGVRSTKGSTLSLYYHPSGAGHYSGWTSGANIDFYTSTVIPNQNFYHEYGHLIDNMSSNLYSQSLGANAHYASNTKTYLWGGNGIDNINIEKVLYSTTLRDPNWDSGAVYAVQHPSDDPIEQWADVYANLVVDNIKDKDLLEYLHGGPHP